MASASFTLEHVLCGSSCCQCRCCCGVTGQALLHTLALPELRLKWPRLTAGIFQQEAKNDNFFVGGLHSRTLAQMDTITALMKQTLNVQLLVSPMEILRALRHLHHPILSCREQYGAA